jgi:S1-C subfamily serine protease
MSEQPEWALPKSIQINTQSLDFNIYQALDSLVFIRMEAFEDGLTANTLGTERNGYGVVISPDGLILTIGYLITEASKIWITTNKGVVLPGFTLAYDQTTGFGLIQPLGQLDVPHLEMGSSASVEIPQKAYALGHGGLAHSMETEIIAKQEFVGFWEYLVENALYTTPAHPHWCGAALVDARGQLIGIGSLLVQQESKGQVIECNMFVPIDLLKPILEDLIRQGKTNAAPRPWLGMYTVEAEGQLMISFITPGSPAEKAGIKDGDQVIKVNGKRVFTLSQLWQTIWDLGEAGVKVPLSLARDGELISITPTSIDRNTLLKKPIMH